MAWSATGPAVVIENNDLQEPVGPIGIDVEVTVGLAHHTDGVADLVLDVLVGNTVLAGVVRYLHLWQVDLRAVRELAAADRDFPSELPQAFMDAL